MTSFDEMLDKYGLSREIFGITSGDMPVTPDTTVVQDAHWIPAAQDVTVVPVAPGMAAAKIENVPVASEPEHDPSMPPWGSEEDDVLAGAPDLNDDAADYPF
ncbi:hypothetical protein [Desulfovibrio sp. TomC]|uniref:hypothetical protein n=1 Tax=Desulfovibrio sp. TomC TaxID=1562888 RepID=UPI000575024C|nr:hypothetical protein [Desulfovibrio sp. TomC]KHK01330.1 hypothetical protein NY78_3312 [Desulfovibrio sp. TomC]